MRKVIAAVDNSLATRTVLSTAANLAALFAAEVEAIHVITDTDRIARQEAAALRVPFRTVAGHIVPALVEAAAEDDVAALVLGARGHPGHPIGSTALDVITSLLKPVVVVPPDAVRVESLRRVLVPLEGTKLTSLAPKAVIELAHDADVEVVVLHVHGADSLPAFTDQPQHEARAWKEEFVARYCPWGIGKVSLELRVGRREEEILAVAAETQSHLIALGWSQEFAAGRAPVISRVLERCRVPVLLVPVHVVGSPGQGQGQGEETPWNSLQSLRA
jgi:nucleotide-binding universal stress UspA family protein